MNLISKEDHEKVLVSFVKTLCLSGMKPTGELASLNFALTQSRVKNKLLYCIGQAREVAPAACRTELAVLMHSVSALPVETEKAAPKKPLPPHKEYLVTAWRGGARFDTRTWAVSEAKAKSNGLFQLAKSCNVLPSVILGEANRGHVTVQVTEIKK